MHHPSSSMHQKNEAKFRSVRKCGGKDGGGTIKGVSDRRKDETRTTVSLGFSNQFSCCLISACSFGDNGVVRHPEPRRGTSSSVVSLQHFMGLNFNIANKQKGAAAGVLFLEHESFLAQCAEVLLKKPTKERSRPLTQVDGGTRRSPGR